jgi:5-formyltetrahydrofolate cyclo-ligase
VTKDKLRAILRDRRKSFVRRHGREIPFPNKFHEIAKNGSCIAGYAATAWEADLSGWWPHLRANSHQLALPYLEDRSATMEFREWNGISALVCADFGFEQPRADAPVAHPDIILVPLIGFDRSGNRLGQGQGHYDRYLSLFSNTIKIGIAFSCQELESVCVDHWDIPLDAIVTEREWISCSINMRTFQ